MVKAFDKLNKLKYKKIDYFIVIFIVFISDSLLTSTISNDYIRSAAKWSIVVLAGILLFWYLYKYKSIKKNFIPIWANIYILIISMLINKDFTGSYILKVSVLLFAFLFSHFFDNDKFLNIYLRVMRFIAIVSLVALIFSDYLIDYSIIPVVRNTVDREYFTLFITNLPLARHLRARNMGPFWEPGAYQSFLIIALFIALFTNNKFKKLDIIIFSLTLISTFSTTAVISIVPVFIAYILSREKFSRKSYKSIIIIVGLLGIGYIFLNESIYTKLFEKIHLGIETDSFASRYFSIVGNIELFLKNPLLGVGPNMMEEGLGQYSVTGRLSVVNTILLNFSMFGVVVGTYYINIMYKFIHSFIKSKFIVLIVLFGFFLTLSGENFVYSAFFNTIFFMRKNHKQVLNQRNRQNNSLGINTEER